MDVRRLMFGPALAFALAACISNPTPHPGADATSGGKDVNEALEDSADLGADATAPARTDFPPAEVTIVLRDVVVRDLDGDGFDDVLLTNAPDAAPEDWGVFVMRGHATRADLLATDHFVATEPRPDQVLPTHLTAAAGGFELAVFGATGPDAGDAGVLEIHPFDGVAFGAPLRRVTSTFTPAFRPAGGTEDAGQPVILAVADATGDGQPDLLLGDLYDLRVLHPASWTAEAFNAADNGRILPEPLFSAILQVFPVTFEDATWLAVLQQDMQVRYFPLVPGAGYSLAGEQSVDLGDEQGIRATEITDVDGDGLPDITTVFTDTLSVLRFEPPEAELYELDPDITTTDDLFEDVAVGDVDGSGAPDIVLLDRAPTGQKSWLRLLRDPDLLDGSPRGAISLLEQVASLDLPSGVYPSYLAVGRFGPGGTAIWTFDRDGAPRCYRWDGDASALAPCP